MTTVYIGHIGKDDRDKVVKIATKFGIIVSSTPPRRSKNADRVRYPGSHKVGLDPDEAYYMFVTMDTPEHASKLISSMPDGWDFDITEIGFSGGGQGSYAPIMYAALSATAYLHSQ